MRILVTFSFYIVVYLSEKYTGSSCSSTFAMKIVHKIVLQLCMLAGILGTFSQYIVKHLTCLVVRMSET